MSDVNRYLRKYTVTENEFGVEFPSFETSSGQVSISPNECVKRLNAMAELITERSGGYELMRKSLSELFELGLPEFYDGYDVDTFNRAKEALAATAKG